MGGYSTQSRQESIPLTYRRGYSNNTVSSDTVPMLSRHQETYSYRSSVEVSEEDQIEELRYLRSHPLSQKGYKPSYDKGHDFWTRDIRLVTKPSLRRAAPFPKTGEWVEGPFIARPTTSSAAGADVSTMRALTPRMTDSQIASMGAKFISSTAPTQPQSSLATFLGEFVGDGLPSLFGSVLRAKGLSARSFSEEYLNVQFGWIPFLNDVKKLLNAVVHSYDIVEQFRRDSGKFIRRRRWLPPERTYAESTIVDSSSGNAIFRTTMFSALNFAPRQCKIQDVITTQWGFSAAYSFFLDPGDTVMGRMKQYEQLANQLLGTRLTAEVLWELTPWSWLIDWMSDMGDIISSASLLSEDGLVLRYGYLMRTTRAQRSVVFDTRGVPGSGATGTSIKSNTLWTSVLKERVGASPYGFGSLYSPSTFSARQWSILAALGMTSGPRTLRRG